MATSILYHAFGLKGIHHEATQYIQDTIIFKARMSSITIKCPHCGSREATFKDQKRRLLRLGHMGRKRSFLDLQLHRLECRKCSRRWWPSIPFADGKHRYVRSFALTVQDLLKFGTIQSVSAYLGVGWDLVKEIHKTRLSQIYRKIELRDVRYIGIDEFSIRKGHEYMTIFTDLKTGRILHAVEGRSKEDIRPFIEKLSRKAKKLKAIAMDMSNSYCLAVREWLPRVDIVFDRYHIMALMNNALDEIRRSQQKELDKIGKQTLKGSRFLLLTNYADLKPDRKARLDELLQANRPLFVAHSMKEQLRLFWEMNDLETATEFLKVWCRDAMQSGIMALAKVAKTLGAYRIGLLNYFKHFITNGVVEGINNKIKTLKRQAYGFRDMVYFKLRLYHLHTQRYSLSG